MASYILLQDIGHHHLFFVDSKGLANAVPVHENRFSDQYCPMGMKIMAHTNIHTGLPFSG